MQHTTIQSWRQGRLASRAQGAERFVSGNQVELLTEAGRAFEEMLASIEAAERMVWLEMYWFASDQIGRRFFEALAGAARRGVDVKVVVDAFGSFATEQACFDALRSSGASVEKYNPLQPFARRAQLMKLTRRNHRKLLICDWQVAFVGGLNIADQWLPHDLGGEGWRDDVALVRGPVVQRLGESFVTSWREVTSRGLPVASEGFPAVGDIDVAVIDQADYAKRRGVLSAYLWRLSQAREQISISNAYFVPNRRIRAALVAALRRGVSVSIMLPGISDVPLIRHASRAVWGRLLRHGARIFEWQPTVLHSKTAIIDRRWVTIGSFNLDYASVRNNRELNLSFDDPGFAELVTAAFERDLTQCVEVDAHDFQFRSLSERLAERVLYWFRAWL
jgi:cardiolipin synthase